MQVELTIEEIQHLKKMLTEAKNSKLNKTMIAMMTLQVMSNGQISVDFGKTMIHKAEETCKAVWEKQTAPLLTKLDGVLQQSVDFATTSHA